MAEYMTTKEASILWGISERRILTLCKNKRINGAYKDKRWFIPKDTVKPTDNRIKTGAYIKDKTTERLPLPIGVSNYIDAVSEYYTVDKTLMIKDLLDEKAKVRLFTRPRRFGKTLNMNMLKTFFELSGEDTSKYFKDKKIWNCGQKYRDYQGKYPVISITFKDVKNSNWKDTVYSISSVLSNEYRRHSELLNSSAIDEQDKEYYKKIASYKASDKELEESLKHLSKMLHLHYGIKPIIIIDEYDTPIQCGYVSSFYSEVIEFMRNFFSGAFKDNDHLSFGFLTGILRVAKESIFSGLNNLMVYTILDYKYSEYFGFTEKEVKEIVTYYNVQDIFDEICRWYDGYQFGETEIFNPWSVAYYLSNECMPRPYWVETSSNDIISEMLMTATEDNIIKALHSLLEGDKIVEYIDINVIYPRLKDNSSSIFSFLLMTGYLKAVSINPALNGGYMCELAIPNKEIVYVYNKEIISLINSRISSKYIIDIQLALYKGDSVALKEKLQQFLLQSVSFYDVANETFYHGLMLGLCAVMANEYIITSNTESGNGRYDICMEPKNKTMPGVVIELKASKDATNLEKLAKDAIKQIDDKRYAVSLEKSGIEKIFKYGVAFSGKSVEIEVV